MQRFKTRFFICITLIQLSISGGAQNMEAQFDGLLQKEYKADGPGVTALVAKDGKVVYRKAFGMANLELKVAMKPEHVLELGSITKQFTAVAILMLKEQGKLNLEDEITRFIPDYPVNGKKITIHHLLNHTSGIKSYTDVPQFLRYARMDMSPKQLIDSFKTFPMEFDPGEKWKYNNSGYILLGYIIEKASGKPYEEFITENIFKKLAMKNSYYGSKKTIIPNRASGYTNSGNGYTNAEYLSMTLPYAAGSLMSNVDDLLIWNQAVHNNTLISKESKAKAFTNTLLNNNKPTYYGYGWGPNDINGLSSLEHSGGIFGYSTMGVYVPEQNVYVVALSNTNSISPSDAAIKMAAIAVGKPYAEKATITLSKSQLEKWTGVYEFENGVNRTITLENDTLYSQKDGAQKLKLIPTGPSSFIFENSTTQYEFFDANGIITALLKARIEHFKGIKSDKKVPAAKTDIQLDAEILKSYSGSYEIKPNFVIEITVDGKQIFGQATGQPKFEMFAEKKDHFYLKVVQATIEFKRNEKNEVTSLILNQGGLSMEGKKL